MYDSLENEGPSERTLSPLYNTKEGLITKQDIKSKDYLNEMAALSNSHRDYDRTIQLRKRS